MRASPALVVFARAPEAGAVKTRLVPYLTPEEAADLYAAFVGDALEAWTRPGAFDLPVAPTVRLYIAPGGGRWPAGVVPKGAAVFEQRGEGLGARMLRAAIESFAAGHDRVVIVGTDHPTLPTAFMAEAFRALDEPFSVVLGPSDDGGYYLVGLNEVAPSLFEDLTYGHSRVFAQALDRAVAAGMRPVLLPEWYDVDTPAQLERLIADRAAGADPGPRTSGVLDILTRARDRQSGGAGNDFGSPGME